jgi:hypothetical protein
VDPERAQLLFSQVAVHLGQVGQARLERGIDDVAVQRIGESARPKPLGLLGACGALLSRAPLRGPGCRIWQVEARVGLSQGYEHVWLVESRSPSG